ncbi:MAG: 1,4-dihydroxy-6-naphthoate synthase [Prevotellaceae bacterium]|jgi:1,4-dihydroxy-6-naphthoate synthase|nr:1,4-dihydroxy-6-naphthoate synthase [Prevotellaceae bacterium]
MTPIPLYFSPCPNDTFCFHAMISGLVDTEGLPFDPHLEDVEQLNHRVLHNNPSVCKISYHILPLIANRYRMLPCGSALGFGNGPLLVSLSASEPITPQTRIAIPGIHTTAHFLLQQAYPQAINTHPVLFSKISDAILSGDFDAGVLIHEGRFIYAQQGLHLVADLGACWEERTGLPIPLGGIAVSRTLTEAMQQKIARILLRSIKYAKEFPQVSASYIRSNAQEIDSEVIRKHIELFVNDYTLDLGRVGRAAVAAMINVGAPSFGTILDLFV